MDSEVFDVIIESEEEEEDNHFPNANSDRNHAILIWEALLFDEALEVGDEVAVITPGGLCAGSIKLTEDDDPEEPFGLAAWGDNPDTEDEVEGFVEDEELTFLFWDASSSVEVVAEAEYMNGPERWRRDGMSRVRLAGDEIFWFQIILEPDESVEIPVTFHPVEIAEYEGTLTIVSNDPDAEEVTVNLFGGGRGVNSPELNNPIEDVEIDEDSGEQIIVDLDDVFIDPDEDVLRYEIIASIEELNLSIAKETNELIIETALNWNGEAEVVIQASDGIEREQAALDTFLVIVNPVNDLPSPFDLEGPEDDAEVADYPTVSFSWGESFDEIEADTVTYGLLLTWNNTDHWYQDIESASIEIHRDDLCVDSNQATELEWKVFAYDSEDSVESDHTFQLTIAPLSVTNADNELPEEFSLSPVYPNPFNPSAQIDFALPQTTNIKLTVWDAAGRHLNVIASGQFPAGYHNVTWHANNLPTGVYIFSLETEEIRLVTKGILIR
ncbi:MAG: T9SS type A sorting domain-containing protein [Calditrichaeota bacterium]|nr:T9SS type A sorting domain-containing protein [Calditrichota bacterium]